ncbi:hypothetical protein VTK73DRAFT_4679 [Phialemonium thermophilum]|uniref:Uncharacterized protein n=1 Tax=Phialemonium thermophilum TaxID=223376 RepID=A0ABR3V6T3_9PEZI
MIEHLIRHIHTKVAAPALYHFLDPANHVAKRRKLGLEDPLGSSHLPPIVLDDAGYRSPVSTPNSRADPIERRTARLDVSALPRIRKAKSAGGLGSRKHAFNDPFARQRPVAMRHAFRSLHHRLEQDSDAESEDEAEIRDSLARDTEEPESRPRSRMSTDDEGLKDDYGSWAPAEEDSMTEASFALDPVAGRDRKRKLDLQIETAIKRQKKTDEELFGVTIDRIETEFPSREASEDVTLAGFETVAEKETDSSRMPTPVPVGTKAKKKAAAAKPKKKTKKQLFEEREALRREEEEEAKRSEEASVEKAETPGEIEPPGLPKVDEAGRSSTLPGGETTTARDDDSRPDLDENLYPVSKVPALVLPPDFSLDVASRGNSAAVAPSATPSCGCGSETASGRSTRSTGTPRGPWASRATTCPTPAGARGRRA